MTGSDRINFSPYSEDSNAADMLALSAFNGSDGDGLYSATIREFKEFIDEYEVDPEEICVFDEDGQEIPDINALLYETDIYDE